jgi:AraC-like DNA-binding protein
MIVVQLSDSTLRRAARRAAHVEEDVVSEEGLVIQALDWGFPRLVVTTPDAHLPMLPPRVPHVELDAETVRRWELERRAGELPVTRLEHATRRLSVLFGRPASDRSWVDAALADLSRAAGAQLPPPLRGFGRRILEFPVHYTTLRPVAEACAMSRGALKAKFRRRGLASPHAYLRWFRTLALAHLLSDRAVTVAAVAQRTGCASSGNLCRTLRDLCGMTPTEARTVHGWNRLLITFAWHHLGPEALEAWSDLDELFERRVA